MKPATSSAKGRPAMTRGTSAGAAPVNETSEEMVGVDSTVL
jgi:hypothetical protein